MNNHKKVSKINDPRLASYINRQRSGSTQLFYTGNDPRDWDRYRAEGGGRYPDIEMHNKPDCIEIEAPERHYYAELIDGEWWWVNGCEECNGRPRSWKTYIECDAHNVCRTCGIPRAQLTEIPWGGSNGWQCKSCEASQRAARLSEALAKVASEGVDHEYTSKVVCPKCGESYTPDGTADGDVVDCELCETTFRVSEDVSVTYSTEIVSEL